MTRMTTLCTAFVLAVTAACSGGKDTREKNPKELGIELPSAVADDSAKAMTRPAPAPVVDSPAAPEPAPAPAPEAVRPTTYRALMATGKQAYADGEYEEALELFGDAAAKARKVATPRIEMARTLLELGRVAKARTHAEAAIEMDPHSSYAWNTLGRVELAEGARIAAIASFERAVEENENNTYAWNNLGYTLLLEERYEDAAAALEAATAGSVHTAYMWNNLGLAYEHLDRIVEARAAYREAAALGSAKAEASLDRLEGVVSLIPNRDSAPDRDEVDEDEVDEHEVDEDDPDTMDVDEIEDLLVD